MLWFKHYGILKDSEINWLKSLQKGKFLHKTKRANLFKRFK